MESWTDSSLIAYSPYVWAKFALPDDPQLAGTTLDVTITLPVSYPAMIDRNTFDDARKKLYQPVPIMVAAPEVKQANWSSWKIGAWTGMLGSTLGGLLLALFTRRHGATIPDEPI